MVVLTAVALALNGCGEQQGSEASVWPTSDRALSTGTVVWESFGSVHVNDDTVIEIGPGATRRWVAAGPGVWSYTPGSTLRLNTPSAQTDSQVVPFWSVLAGSADGTWLVYLEMVDDSPHLITLNTLTGEVTSRTDVGLREAVKSSGWQRQLTRQKVGVVGFSGDTVVFRGTTREYAVEAAAGTATSWARDESPGRAPTLDSSPALTRGAWTIKPGGNQFTGVKRNRVRALPPGGVGKVALLRWHDDRTAMGLWRRPGRPTALVGCVATDGECHLVLGTEEGFTLPNDHPIAA